MLARAEQSGGHRLVAYVTAQDGLTLEPEALQAALTVELPEIMVPASLVVLRAFPLTPNGKVDRAALPDPRAAAVLPLRPLAWTSCRSSSTSATKRRVMPH